MTRPPHDALCRVTNGWFCRHAFWPLQRGVEHAGWASLAARVNLLDAEVHPERYVLPAAARAAWDADHVRGAA